MAVAAEQIVGRAAELGQLERSLAELERGRPSALEIEGEPGIGKTRLLSELGARADRRGWLVLGGSASELERDLPFWLFVDALDEYVQGLEPRRIDELGDEACTELAHVFPSLPAADAPAQGDRYRTHRAFCRLLETLAARKPLVLLLDDLHWADGGSLELLGSLLRRPPDAAVLIVVALRPRQVPERLAVALERARRGGMLTRLELGGLSRDEAHALLGDVSPAAAAALHAQSGGNPFYLEQLARSPQLGAAGGEVSLAGVQVPRAVAAALAEELAVLSDVARRVLDGAAVAGDPFEPELAAAAAAVAEPSAVEALDELLGCDLVRPTDVPRRFRFRHPLVRGAVYEATPGGWRLGAHERCAAALAARGASAAARAHHVEHSGRHGDAAAVAVLREAAEAAAARDPATAARLYGGALRLLAHEAPAGERVALLGALARAHMAAGQFVEAHTTMLDALALLPREAVAQRVALTAGCAALENLLGRHHDAHARLTAALESLADRGSPEGVALELELAMDGFYRMDYELMGAWSQRALLGARALRDVPARSMAASGAAFANVLAGHIQAAQAARDEAAEVVDAMPDEELARSLRGATNLAAAEAYLDRVEAAGVHVERAFTVAAATGQGQFLPLLFWVGMIRAARGRLADSAELLDAAVEIARLSGHTAGTAWCLLARSLTATAAGDVPAALAAAQESVEAQRGLDRSLPAVWAGSALTEALLADGDPASATAVLLDSAGGEGLPLVPAGWRAAGFELLTRCRLAQGRRDDAVGAARRAAEAAAPLGLRLAAAAADRAAAAVALDRDDPAEAAARALASAAAAGEAGAVIESATSRVLAGRALALAGEPERATAELMSAAATFDCCGAIARRDAAERELRRLGHKRLHRRTRAGQADGSGIESLTERELQVARLVVDRRTNAQIAAELFLSTKTVESHIRNLFHKLGVSSRVEVARAVERADRSVSSR